MPRQTLTTSLTELATPGGTPQSETITDNKDVNVTPNVTTTTNATAPKILQDTPRTHHRITRNNTP